MVPRLALTSGCSTHTSQLYDKHNIEGKMMIEALISINDIQLEVLELEQKCYIAQMANQ